MNHSPENLRCSIRPVLRPSLWRFIQRSARGAIIGLLLALFAYGAFLAAVAWWPYPPGISAASPSSPFIEDQNGVPLAALVAADQQWRIPLSRDQISPHLFDAL